ADIVASTPRSLLIGDHRGGRPPTPPKRMRPSFVHGRGVALGALACVAVSVLTISCGASSALAAQQQATPRVITIRRDLKQPFHRRLEPEFSAPPAAHAPWPSQIGAISFTGFAG